MVNETDGPLEEASDLRHAPIAPPMLEARVVAALRADGLIRADSGRSRFIRIAASLLIFAAGATLGRLVAPATPTSPGPNSSPARYLLLLAGDETPAADGSSRAAEYGAWARSLGARGIAVSGEELAGHAEVVSHRPAATFPDVASVGGYFLIEADNDAAAAALARTCPHVKYGGSIVVRRIR